MSACSNAYLSGLPLKFLRIVAGFSVTPGGYFLARATIEPPERLRLQLFPRLEEWQQRFAARAAKKSWGEGGLDRDDISAQAFCALLQLMRSVVLQDLAVLQPEFPQLPLFRLPLFHGEDWSQFALLVQAAHTENNLPRSLLVERALPEVSNALVTATNALRGGQSSILEQAAGHHQELRDGINQVAGTLRGGIHDITRNQNRLYELMSAPFTLQFGAGTSEVR
jgi:Centromere DNA-binding protein complex CBF3 subunit, domain 2